MRFRACSSIAPKVFAAVMEPVIIGIVLTSASAQPPALAMGLPNMASAYMVQVVKQSPPAAATQNAAKGQSFANVPDETLRKWAQSNKNMKVISLAANRRVDLTAWVAPNTTYEVQGYNKRTDCVILRNPQAAPDSPAVEVPLKVFKQNFQTVSATVAGKK